MTTENYFKFSKSLNWVHIFLTPTIGKDFLDDSENTINKQK